MLVNCTSESQNLLHRRQNKNLRALIEKITTFSTIYKTFWSFHCILQNLDYGFFSPGKNICSVNTLTFPLSLLCLPNVTFLQFLFQPSASPPYLLSVSFYCSDVSSGAVSPASAAFAPIILVPWSLTAQHLLAANILREPGGVWLLRQALVSQWYSSPKDNGAQFDVFKMRGDSPMHPQVQGSVWENHMGYGPGEKMGPGELAHFQGWLRLSSGTILLYK